MSRTPRRRPTSGLSPDASRDLTGAFAAEVATRLPRLVDAAARLGTDPLCTSVVVTDAHALATSAAILGEDAAAHAARTCEQLLLPFCARSEVPPAVVAQAYGAAEAMSVALAHWTTPPVPQQREATVS